MIGQVTYINNPLTVVTIPFGVNGTSKFYLIGLSVIIVAKPFHQVLLFSLFSINNLIDDTNYYNQIITPQSYAYASYLVSCSFL
jgi:hypothetical protein